MGELTKINNTLTSTSDTEALSAYQGQILNNKKLNGCIVASTPTTSSTTNTMAYVQYDNIETQGSIMDTIRNTLFPVGTIYQSTSPHSPQDLFGGTWSALEGKFLIGVSSLYSAGATGGTATVTLTAAQSGRPAFTLDSAGAHRHTHVWKNGALAQATSGSNTQRIYNSGGSDGSHVYYWDNNSAHSHAHTADAIDATSAHNNMPPYKAIYMWVRTA